MKTQNKYKMKDVAKESWRIVKDSNSYYNAKNLLNTFTYYFRTPSGDRVENEIKGDSRYSSCTLKPGSVVLDIVQSLGVFAGTYGISSCINDHIPAKVVASLASLFVTNLASGAYEAVRKARKNLEARAEK